MRLIVSTKLSDSVRITRLLMLVFTVNSIRIKEPSLKNQFKNTGSPSVFCDFKRKRLSISVSPAKRNNHALSMLVATTAETFRAKEGTLEKKFPYSPRKNSLSKFGFLGVEGIVTCLHRLVCYLHFADILEILEEYCNHSVTLSAWYIVLLRRAWGKDSKTVRSSFLRHQKSWAYGRHSFFNKKITT